MVKINVRNEKIPKQYLIKLQLKKMTKKKSCVEPLFLWFYLTMDLQKA